MIGRGVGAIGPALARLFAPRRSRRAEGGKKEVISGSAGNVIIVKSPNTEYFKEAIFILCDDLLTRRGADRNLLLREARRAAQRYVSERVPPRNLSALWHVVFYLLGALSALAAVMLLELT